MTNNPFHPGFRETSYFDAYNHVFLHSFPQYELSHCLITDNQIHLSLCFPRIFFLTAWLYHFEWYFIEFFKEFLTLIRLMLIPFQVPIKQLFSCLIGRLASSTEACCQVHFFRLVILLQSGIVPFVLLSHCLLLAKALLTGDTDEIAQITRSGQFRSLAIY